MKIIHIITSLSEGGVQSLLYNFINNETSNKHVVICLLKNGRSNIYNCGYGKGYSVKDVLNCLHLILKKKFLSK